MRATKEKWAIVLSGGGTSGDFQVGALQAIKEHGLPINIITANSAGAFGAVMFALNRLEVLEKIWLGVGKSFDVFKLRPFAVIRGLLTTINGLLNYAHGDNLLVKIVLKILRKIEIFSLYDNAPLARLINEHVDLQRLRDSGIKVLISVVELQSGRLELKDQHYQHFLKAVLATTAMQIYFEPVLMDGCQYVDGGARRISPLAAAIEAGAKKIIVILAKNRDAFIQPTDKIFQNILEVGVRCNEITYHQIFIDDIVTALVYCYTHGKLDFNQISSILIKEQQASPISSLLSLFQKTKGLEIHFIEPDKSMSARNTLEVDPEFTKKAIPHGRERAEQLLRALAL